MEKALFKSLDELCEQVKDHFGGEILKINKFTEKKLAESNKKKELKRLNEERDVLIQGVEETKELNMKNLNAVLAKKVLNNEIIGSHALFNNFCFVVNYEGRMRLVITDRFISQKELNLVQILAAEISKNADKMKDPAIANFKNIDLISNFFNDVQQENVSSIFFNFTNRYRPFIKPVSKLVKQ
jgi:hypothetical protein